MCTAMRELKEEGRQEGKAAVNKLVYQLANEGRIEDLIRASRDAEYQNELMLEYGING